MQNLSLLTEEAGEENDEGTEQKYWCDEALSASEVKWREVEAKVDRYIDR